MNILMITADHLMIDRRILQEAKSLVQMGHKVILLAGFECKKRESLVVDGILIERFVYDWNDSRFSSLAHRFHLKPGTKTYSLAWKIFRLWANKIASINCFEQFVLERMLEYQVDILHVHDYPMLMPGVALSRLRKIPLVYDAHELYYAQVQLSKKIQRKYKRRENKLIPYANVVITVNPYIASLMEQRYRIAKPNVIVNAAPYQIKDENRRLRHYFSFKENQKIVLYQGWISAHRGIEYLIEAAAFFNEDICLVIVGYGDFEVYLREIVAEKQLAERVYFYGGVPSEQLHALTCDADLGVIPYHGVDENNYYCSPNKLFEFVIAGLPILANDLPFLRDIFIQYGNGVVADLSSPIEIAKKVNDIFSNQNVLQDLRSNSEKAATILNWENEKEKLLEIYQKFS